MENKKIRDKSLELAKLCREYMEENSVKWAQRKIKREQEIERTKRLEKAGIKSRKAKLDELQKNVKRGVEKLPEIEREKLEKEEKKRKEQELESIKRDLWTLKRFEKKTFIVTIQITMAWVPAILVRRKFVLNLHGGS